MATTVITAAALFRILTAIEPYEFIYFHFCRYTAIVFLGVVLLSVAFLAATESLIRAKVIPNDTLRWHVDLFLSGDSENVVFGDSHTAQGVHGVPGFLNLSYPSENVPKVEVKARSYFADKQPGKVVLQADPHMLAPYREDYDERSDARPFETGRKPYLWALARMHTANIHTYWKFYFTGKTFDNIYTFQEDGAFTRTGSWTKLSKEQQLDSAEARISRHRPKQELESTRTAQSYQSVLSFLTGQVAEVCMVRMPVTPLYRRLSANHSEFEDATVFLESLALDYGVRYVDLSDAITDLSLFLNTDHLNERGSLFFAPMLESACFGNGTE